MLWREMFGLIKCDFCHLFQAERSWPLLKCKLSFSLHHLRARYLFLDIYKWFWGGGGGGLHFWVLGLRSSFSTHPQKNAYMHSKIWWQWLLLKHVWTNLGLVAGARMTQLVSAWPSCTRSWVWSLVTSHPCFNLSPLCVTLTTFK